MSIQLCNATLKNKLPCTYKAKFNGRCGLHLLENDPVFCLGKLRNKKPCHYKVNGCTRFCKLHSKQDRCNEQDLCEPVDDEEPCEPLKLPDSPLSLQSQTPEAQLLMGKIEAILKTVHMRKQYRDTTKKVKFNLEWAFLLGNTTNALGAGFGAFSTPHNIKKGRGVCITPVEDRKLPQWKKLLWSLSKQLMQLVDPDFVDGEYVVNYSCMTNPNHYVKKHTDSDDISFQYALTLGDYSGATLRMETLTTTIRCVKWTGAYHMK